MGRRAERACIDSVLSSVRSGQSQVLVLRGEAGIGKSALLRHIAGQANGCRLLVAAGVQADMELAFAGLHHILGALMGGIDRLPHPQRDAMRVAFGMLAAPPPDRFLLGLAVLNLLSAAASEQPVVCLIDDEQWLDRASVQVLAFVARRLDAEAVGIVVATREVDPLLGRLPEMVIDGLSEAEARELLRATLVGPVDPRVESQLLAESYGNPLALLELPRRVSPAELGGGFANLGVIPVSDRIEQVFRHRLDSLPSESRRLILGAAAEPTGSRWLLWRAVDELGIPHEASAPAVEAGLLQIGVRVGFRHPLVRSAVYRSASVSEQRKVHRALAAGTGPRTDPDRRAWHRALAADGPDEDVARDLELSARRAQARGGLAAVAIFLEWAARLTPRTEDHARRLLSAAAAKRDVGNLDAALELLAAIEPEAVSVREDAEIKRLRGQIAFDRRQLEEGVQLFAEAATLFDQFDRSTAQETLGEALCLAIWAGDLHGAFGIEYAAAAVAAATSSDGVTGLVGRVLGAFASRYLDGREIAAPLFAEALKGFLTSNGDSEQIDHWYWVIQSRVSWMLALETWDAASWLDLSTRQVEVARELGAVLHVKHGLNNLVCAAAFMGDLDAAENFAEEARLIADATGTARLQYAEMVLAAYRGDTPAAMSAIKAVLQEAEASHVRLHVTSANWALALLNNGLGRHDVARDAGLIALEGTDVAFGQLVVPELAEAASRTGDRCSLQKLEKWMNEQARVTPTPWARGLTALIRALGAEDDSCDQDYRDAIQSFAEASQRLDAARARLLYGEWLRRRRRPNDARYQLETAREAFVAMGFVAFAARATRELRAAGERAPRRSANPGIELTAQELHIVRLTLDGPTTIALGNPRCRVHLDSLDSSDRCDEDGSAFDRGEAQDQELRPLPHKSGSAGPSVHASSIELSGTSRPRMPVTLPALTA